MRGGGSLAFHEIDEFRTAMLSQAKFNLVLTHGGRFYARLKQTTVDGIRLMSVEESLPRVGFLTVPLGEVFICLPGEKGPAPVWGGLEQHPNGLVVIGPGQAIHMRTMGGCGWRALWLPVDVLMRYGRALTGRTMELPSLARCGQDSPSASRQLCGLHRTAIRTALALSEASASAEAARGLEQELMHAVIECLTSGGMDDGGSTSLRTRKVAVGFEKLLESEVMRRPADARMAKICAALGISDRLLRSSCSRQLGMGPARYFWLHRMHEAHRALSRTGSETVHVSDVASRTGFLHLGRFASAYRQLFGSLPSATLGHRRAPTGQARQARPSA